MTADEDTTGAPTGRIWGSALEPAGSAERDLGREPSGTHLGESGMKPGTWVWGACLRWRPSYLRHGIPYRDRRASGKGLKRVPSVKGTGWDGGKGKKS